MSLYITLSIATKTQIMSLNILSFICLLHFVLASTQGLTAKPGCQSSCGDLIVPYPFGIGSNCSIDSWAEMECLGTSKSPMLFFKHLNNIVVRFSETEVYFKSPISTICYSVYGDMISSEQPYHATRDHFTYSSKNTFIVIGCGMQGIAVTDHYNSDGLMRSSTSECMNFCSHLENSGEEQCEGAFGCCQVPMPMGSVNYHIKVDAINTYAHTTSRCGFAFLADENYRFNTSDIIGLKESIVGLTFSVGDQTCEYAKLEPNSFACKENSFCIDSNINKGYTCNCSEGYVGNPYLDQGCQDVNECQLNNTYWDRCERKCVNTPGSYHYLPCPAPGPVPVPALVPTLVPAPDKSFPISWIIILGLILALLLLVLGGLGIYGRKQRQLSNLREKFFEQNGGLRLQEKISLQATGTESAKIFTEKQLKLATNNYDQSHVLGEGGFGKVYKGVLPDLRVVAIKKAKMIDKDQLEQFINEVDILTRIDHRNIVKLMGCCLEIELPLLVYEFVSNGTLAEHIAKKYNFFSWEERLRIATEVASSLAYLHSSASIPIIHRDVKSSNILLDDDLTAKVADFGASRVNPLDETQISTMVKGTLGYLDPEYMLTNQLTAKSDVYSFGVVLAELLTGEKPLSFERPPEERSLAMYFTMSMEKKRLMDILQDGIVKEDNIKQVHAVAELAGRCLRRSGEDRPSMKEVASELDGIRGFRTKHSSSQKGNHKQLSLYSQQVELQSSSSYNWNSFEYTNTEMIVPLKEAR